MFLSKLFGIFKRKKKDEQQPSGPASGATTTVPTAGVAAGGTVASGANQSPQTISPSEAQSTVSSGDDSFGGVSDYDSTPESQPVGIAQVTEEKTPPAFPSEETAPDTTQVSDQYTDTDNSLSDSTEDFQPPVADEPTAPTQPEQPPEENITPGSDDENIDGSAGPSIG